VIHGMQMLPKIPVVRPPVNTGEDKTRRRNALYRVARGPSHVKRIGHFVVHSPQFEKTLAWYRDMLGFRCSDEVYADRKDHLVGSFNRLDRGDQYVDHHVFFCWQGAKVGLNHVSYEVEDMDDLMLGHQYLANKDKYEHMWGVGRHNLGAQVFDYWADPWRHVHEHWTDSDMLNVASGSNLVSIQDGLKSLWGDRSPPKFRDFAVP